MEPILEPTHKHALTQHQYDELARYIDGEPRRSDKPPNRTLIRRNLLTLAPAAGKGHYRITEFGRSMLSEHRWKGNGITVPDWSVLTAFDDLGFFPEEVLALAEYAKGEAWVWEQMQRTHEDPHICRAIADYFLRREQAWRRLAALLSRELELELEEEGSEEWL